MNDSRRRLLGYIILPIIGYLTVKLYFVRLGVTQEKKTFKRVSEMKKEKKRKLLLLRNSEVCSSSPVPLHH